MLSHAASIHLLVRRCSHLMATNPAAVVDHPTTNSSYTWHVTWEHVDKVSIDILAIIS
jgi:hypothetical protein